MLISVTGELTLYALAPLRKRCTAKACSIIFMPSEFSFAAGEETCMSVGDFNVFPPGNLTVSATPGNFIRMSSPCCSNSLYRATRPPGRSSRLSIVLTSQQSPILPCSKDTLDKGGKSSSNFCLDNFISTAFPLSFTNNFPFNSHTSPFSTYFDMFDSSDGFLNVVINDSPFAIFLISFSVLFDRKVFSSMFCNIFILTLPSLIKSNSPLSTILL